jgi:hypothetical protein
MIRLMDIEVQELAAALVQGQLYDLTRTGGIPPTDDERAGQTSGGYGGRLAAVRQMLRCPVAQRWPHPAARTDRGPGPSVASVESIHIIPESGLGWRPGGTTCRGRQGPRRVTTAAETCGRVRRMVRC